MGPVAAVTPWLAFDPSEETPIHALTGHSITYRIATWSQRLKRVFAIDIDTCRCCGGKLRVIASIEEPAVIERILDHLGRVSGSLDPAHPGRAPPVRERLF